MLERAVENWLDKASERAFQVPFCYMLSRDGYRIVHISAHNAMELGKDILAIDKKGTPCAFQLKSGDITMKKWRDEVSGQVSDLAYGKVQHPSINTSKRHRPFLVTNGQIHEPVQRAIGDMNETLKEVGLPRIETKVGGDLKDEAKALQSDLWPSELVNAKDLLELYLHDGKDVFPKAKLASLLVSALPFAKTLNGKHQPKKRCNRAIASAAVLTALSLSAFSEEQNHVAEIEAWTLYAAYVLALAERWDLGAKYYEIEVEIALWAIKNSLTNLAEEVMGRTYLIEGRVEVDHPFYRVRLTCVAALLCILGLWRRVDGEEESELDRLVRRFIVENRQQFALWGEASVPQFLAIYWHDRLINATSVRADWLLRLITRSLCEAKQPSSAQVLPDIYVEAKEWLPYLVDQELEKVIPDHPFRLAKEPMSANYHGYSHVLEGLVHLLVQQNWKQEVKSLWPAVTRINLHTFEFDKPWHFYRWRNNEGTEWVVDPKYGQHWNELKATASDSSGDGLPRLIKQHSVFALLFVCVCPHRTNAAMLRCLNNSLKKAVYGS